MPRIRLDALCLSPLSLHSAGLAPDAAHISVAVTVQPKIRLNVKIFVCRCPVPHSAIVPLGIYKTLEVEIAI